jgi:hypothetical protein
MFNAFGVIPQFPAIADKLLAETAACSELARSLQFAPGVRGRLQSAGRSQADAMHSVGKAFWKSSKVSEKK